MFKFKTPFAENIFRNKYAQGPNDSWPELARRLVDDVCGTRGGELPFPLLSPEEQKQLVKFITEMKFVPGGRYLYYAGRKLHYYNNCFLLKAEEDTREEWADLVKRCTSALMSGGGIGVDYSVIRPMGRSLLRTGGLSSGPLPLMYMINEIGRNVMQGGSRRSAIYASLNWQHDDIEAFLTAKDWPEWIKEKKAEDFNFPAQLDMTNISINWDTKFIEEAKQGYVPDLWYRSVLNMCKTGEPGHSYNFYENEKETLRNAPLSGETHVLCSDGYARIKDLPEGKCKVWTGRRWAETTFVKTKSNVKTLTVRMTGGRVIYADPEHEFFVRKPLSNKRGKNARYIEDKVPAAKLKPGDTLVTSLCAIEGTGLNPIGYTQGFIIGDGHSSWGGADVSFFAENKIEKVLPCLATPDSTSLDGTRLYYKNNKYASLSKKKVDSTYCVRSFIAGLFDADGYANEKARRITLSSSIYELLEDVRRWLEYYGIQSNINIGSGSSYKPGNKTWSLIILRDSIVDFLTLIPTRRVRFNTDGVEVFGYRKSAVKVVSVEDEGRIEDVFCCDVEYEEHSFCAEGVIVSNCCEVTSENDSDVCNLGSVNMGAIDSLDEFEAVCELGSKFLVCGTLRGDLPYEKVKQVREKNRRLGLGLMGIHEWLLKNGESYAFSEKLQNWLMSYEGYSESGANQLCDKLYINRPIKYRAIAPTGTIGILASTTTGIEPLFAVAYKRRYLVQGTRWKYEYVIDATAERLIKEHGLNPDDIETSRSLAITPGKRIEFQAQVQQFVDHAISSTLNLPAWGSEYNNEYTAQELGNTLLKYCGMLRGMTCYPDGARGGQPLTPVPYEEAAKQRGVVFDEVEEKCIGGICGL